jgi:three-Cys-motif partner protein
MTLEFNNDAICLSGLTGSKIKCDVIGEYYRLWWNITSGGQQNDHKFPASIIELDAGTGEVYIKDIKQTVLGSAGHALNLKCTNPAAKNLKIIAVEKDPDCYAHLKRVIKRRWNDVDVIVAESSIKPNQSNVYLLNRSLEDALAEISKMDLGNALFYFDPLRSVEYASIESVAKNRISTVYKTGTEFIVFLFTSDWFLGRDGFAPLPITDVEQKWSSEEEKTVLEADAFLGTKDWRPRILNNQPTAIREGRLVELYKKRLHRWFRYVLPMPFNPKNNQIFHLILCSNYSVGVRATKNFYIEKAKNLKYQPDNRNAYIKFKTFHPDLIVGLSGAQRPQQWKILWKTIVEHEEGLCDYLCKDYDVIESDSNKRQLLLQWLEQKGYLVNTGFENAWGVPLKQYIVNWGFVREVLGIE